MSQSQISIAGWNLRMHRYAPDTRFPADAGRRVLNIFPGTRPPSRRAPAGQRIAGGRAYSGWWDDAKLTGNLYVPNAARTEHALAGFLRQALQRSLPLYNGVVLHAACVRVGSKACVFAGRSGAGKSTICELADGIHEIMADDMTLIRFYRGQWRAWGWPLINSGAGVPVQAVFRLVQDKKHRVKKTSSALSVAAMLAAPPRGSAPVYMTRVLDLCARLAHELPLYDLHFRPDTGVWQSVEKL